jgi:hypothetical protein
MPSRGGAPVVVVSVPVWASLRPITGRQWQAGCLSLQKSFAAAQVRSRSVAGLTEDLDRIAWGWVIDAIAGIAMAFGPQIVLCAGLTAIKAWHRPSTF